MKRTKTHVALLLCLIATTAIAQTGTVERRFALPGHGNFVIQVPRDWKDQVRQQPNQLPPTIAFGPGSGNPFQVVMIPIWPPTKDYALPSRDQVRAAIERVAQEASSQAVEKELRVVELQGRSGAGFYFSATDRAPKPGAYKFLTQGTVLVGQLVVNFTILTNDGQEAIVKQALDALKGAAQNGV
ncbi:MAG TPA: hypothetical protein VML91_22695 [Burkholderiales bacterium]|nr:hypothetical protein [Burkholderiales bacterium]